jgi:hypothetical protein
METRTQRELYYSSSHWMKRKKTLFKDNPGIDQAAIRDRVYHAHVMDGLMSTHNPDRNMIINGVNFDMMLDDAKKNLHSRIDEKAKESFDRSIQKRFRDEMAKFFELVHEAFKPNPSLNPFRNYKEVDTKMTTACVGEKGPEIIKAYDDYWLKSYQSKINIPVVDHDAIKNITNPQKNT